uniref:J domain-containing protein n=1 Tax=Ditylenchus dipsaci TaxID=166011 RepID=A0A915DEB9_9BILA
MAKVDYYEVLGIAEDANSDQIKRAYRKLALMYHPDKNDDPTAEDFFKSVGKAYYVLSDPAKKEAYDKFGDEGSEDALSGESGVDLANIWRSMFKKVTKEAIDEYIKNYRSSETEVEDIKNAYVKHKGNMNYILEEVIGADVENEDRICEIIQLLIDSGEVEPYKKFVTTSAPPARIKRQAKAKKEAVEAAEALEELSKKNGFEEGKGDLVSMLMLNKQKREAGLESLISNLERKYVDGKKKGKKRPKHQEENVDDEDELPTAKPPAHKRSMRRRKK